MPKYAEKYAICALCEKRGKVPNMRQSHIRVFLTCLIKPYTLTGNLPVTNPITVGLTVVLLVFNSNFNTHMLCDAYFMITMLPKPFCLLNPNNNNNNSQYGLQYHFNLYTEQKMLH